MITSIKTAPNKYFFSGDIRLSPGQEVFREVLELTETQLLDIVEALSLRSLIVSEELTITEQYKVLSQGYIGPTSSTLDIDDTVSKAHEHLNLSQLNSIGEDLDGNLTFKNLPISGSLSELEIKTKYEANLNTNAFTDTYKDKLDTLGESVSITSELGPSDVLAASQKLLTDSLGDIQAILESINGEVTL